jgi:hypothetical protein
MPLGHTDARQETTKKDKIAERRKIWLISLFSFTFFIILSIVFSNKSDTIYQQSSIIVSKQKQAVSRIPTTATEPLYAKMRASKNMEK